MGDVPKEVIELCRVMSEDDVVIRTPPFFIVAHPDAGLKPAIHQSFETPYGKVFLTVHENVAESGEIKGISEALYRYKLSRGLPL